MKPKGGCCIARSATKVPHHISNVDRIMLKFRPIAPKPLPAGTLSDASSSESGADAFSRSGGAKRRNARKDNSKRCSRGIRRSKKAPPMPAPAVTLPLLPETPDPKKTTAEEAVNKNVPVWPSFDNNLFGGAVSEKMWYPPVALSAAGSVVTVECVTDTWQDDGLGDEERKVKLGEDTCPAFISDGHGRVTWTNGVYREIVSGVGVWLAMKMTVPYPYRAFTCRVRVQYACGIEKTVACDVWRMDSTGGFAWRLDVNAALNLSLAL